MASRQRKITLFAAPVDAADEINVDLGAGTYSFIINTVVDAKALSGTVELLVTATDRNGRETESTIDLLDYGTGPQITIGKPDQNSSYASTVRVEGQAIDRGLVGTAVDQLRSISYDIASLLLSGNVDLDDLVNAAFFFEPLDGSFWFEFSTIDFNQNLSVVVTAIDRSLRESIHIINLVPYSTGPIIDVTAPINYSNYRSMVSIAGSVRDQYSAAGSPSINEVKSVAYSIPAKSISGPVNVSGAAPTLGDLSASFATVDEGAGLQMTGTQYLIITATDWNGRESEQIIVLNDYPTGPELAITSPENFSEFKSLVTVDGTVRNQDSQTFSVSEVDSASIAYRVPVLGLEGSVVLDVDFATNGKFSFSFSAENNTKGCKETTSRFFINISDMNNHLCAV